MNSSIQEYIQNIKNIQNSILCFIESIQNDEENYQNLIQILDDHKILNDLYEIKLILKLISQIANYHYHTPGFYEKIEQILKNFQPIFQEHLSNKEIFDIFSQNKRILLFLITEKIIFIDKPIFEAIYKNNFIAYFTPEINDFLKGFSEKEQKYLFSNARKKINNKNYYSKDYYKNCLDIYLLNNNNNNEEEEEEKEEMNEDNYEEEIYDENYYDFQLIQEIPDDFYEKRKIGENDDEICQIKL